MSSQLEGIEKEMELMPKKLRDFLFEVKELGNSVDKVREKVKLLNTSCSVFRWKLQLRV